VNPVREPRVANPVNARDGIPVQEPRVANPVNARGANPV